PVPSGPRDEPDRRDRGRRVQRDRRGLVARASGPSGRDGDPPEAGLGGDRNGPSTPLRRLGGPVASHVPPSGPVRPPRAGFPPDLVRGHGSGGRGRSPPPHDRPGGPPGTAPDRPSDRR